jgi:hypothetical protein
MVVTGIEDYLSLDNETGWGGLVFFSADLHIQE